MKLLFRLVLLLCAMALLALVVYVFALRPWLMSWGATKDELAMEMVGDQYVADPDFQYTQAITIEAPQDIVWGYLVQIGYRRAGFYNVDWINRLMLKDFFYEGGKSANRIIPELQSVQVGDIIELNPYAPFKVIETEPQHHLLLAAEEKDTGKLGPTWLFALQAIDEDTTRFVVRWRSRSGVGFGGKVMDAFAEAGACVQQPTMLRGLKQRAEAEYRRAIGN